MHCRYETEHRHETRIHHVAGAFGLRQQKKIRIVAACVNDRGGDQDDALADAVVRSLDQGKEQRNSVDQEEQVVKGLDVKAEHPEREPYKIDVADVIGSKPPHCVPAILRNIREISPGALENIIKKARLEIFRNFHPKFLDDFGIIAGEAPRVELRKNVVRESVSTLAISFGRHYGRDRLKDTSPCFPSDLLIHAIMDAGAERRTEYGKSDQSDQREPNCLVDAAPGAAIGTW